MYVFVYVSYFKKQYKGTDACYKFTNIAADYYCLRIIMLYSRRLFIKSKDIKKATGLTVAIYYSPAGNAVYLNS